MSKGRLEAFSDGVIAILITIMVLELKVPHDDSLAALVRLIPLGLTYLLSYVYIGIYWNNHHHMMHTVERVDGSILWANLHLLFWLSLVPFSTGWMGENHFHTLPAAVYGINLLGAALAYTLMQTRIIRLQGPNSKLKTAVGNDLKGKLSGLLYVVAIPSAFYEPWVACSLYVIVALIWFVPDKRIERTLGV